MLQKLSFRITGTVPLVMHNGQLADPLNRFAREIKKISGRRGKTDEDHLEMARLEFLGGLYLSGGEPCIPGDNIQGMLIGKGGAARKQKKGGAAAAGVFVLDNFPLEYEGPRDPHDIWANEDFRFRKGVKVQTSRIMRTRPIFNEWATTIEIHFNPQLVNEEEICHWMEVAGQEIGLCDWRPRFGRFTVEKL